MESLFVVTAVVGFVEVLRRAYMKDWFSVLTIIGATIIGLVAGYYKVEGLTLTTGLIAGLGASGLVTVASKVNTTR
ncbi:hypothetical protein [Polynucleobacter sp.]|uniref:hypothetical protein n=1 Tax=Polynucleobacter sp. TaxID=2029855 RepID=UPI003F69AF47